MHRAMEFINGVISQLAKMRWSDYLDILLVAYLLYRLIPLLYSKTTMRIVQVIVAVLLISSLTEIAHLYALNFILKKLMTVGVLAIVILFQPELRRALDRIGSAKLDTLLGLRKDSLNRDTAIAQIAQVVEACEAMSRDKIGALIVFARNQSLSEYMKTGTEIDAMVSEQLLRNIFFPKAALHDGAMIIVGGRVAAAGCVLPLSSSDRLSADLGTRHRAGVGMSEATDAVVVIVSEETGTISVALDGMLKRHLAPQTLEKLLRAELLVEDAEAEQSVGLRLRQKLAGKGKSNEE